MSPAFTFTLVVLAAILLLLASRVFQDASTSQLLVSGTLLTLSIAPIPLLALSKEPSAYIVGIASPTPTIYTYTVLLAAGTAWALWTAKAPNTLVPFLGLCMLILMLAIRWEVNALTISGVLHTTLLLCAWVVGSSVSVEFSVDHARGYVAGLLAFIATVLAVPTWVQWALGSTTANFGERASGVFAHPSTVGKVAIVIAALALPLTSALQASVARTAGAAVLLSGSAVVPSLSRANVAGILVLLTVWFAFDKTKSRRRLLPAFALGALVAVPLFLGRLVRRFRIDPQGSERPQLLAAGLRQLESLILWGTGPNNYVPIVAPREQIVAETGFPVHNALLLLLSEYGLVAVVFIGVLLCALSKGMTPWGRRITSRTHSTALLALVAALATVSWTGWGLLRAPMPQLILFTFAVLRYQAIALPVPQHSTNSPTAGFQRRLPRSSPSGP